MSDRRLPHARTIKVLRILAWPYQYPPLSWIAKGVDWVSATSLRLTIHSVVCAAILIGALIARG